MEVHARAAANLLSWPFGCHFDFREGVPYGTHTEIPALDCTFVDTVMIMYRAVPALRPYYMYLVLLLPAVLLMVFAIERHNIGPKSYKSAFSPISP